MTTPTLLDRIRGVRFELQIQWSLRHDGGLLKTLLELPGALWHAWKDPDQAALCWVFCELHGWWRNS